MSEKTKWKVKGVSAPKEWWERIEDAQNELGIESRSNLIRIAVDDYLKDYLVDRRPVTAPA